MANIDKNIVITPNISNTSEPKIVFTGGNNNPTTLRVLDDGTLSFEGGAGQLFSISNTATGQIFAVNDISGYPLSEVYSNGFVSLARSYGRVVIGNNTAANAAMTILANSSVSALDIQHTATPQSTGYLKTPSGTRFTYNTSNELVIMNLGQLRFTDGVGFNYDNWGGIKYTTANNTMIIGGPGAPGITNNGVVSANLIMHNATTGNFMVANSSATNLFVGANGNVGIGNTTPGTVLVTQISDNNFAAAVQVRNSNTGGQSQAILDLISDSGTLRLFRASIASGIGAGVYVATADPLVFYTNAVSRVHIAGNGNVGIACSTPTWSFHAGSSARIEGTVSVGGSGTFSIDAPNISNGRLIVTADPTGNATNGSPNANVGIGVAAPVYKLQVNGAVAFVNSSVTQSLFAANGNVGIGNTTPAQTLVVGGKVSVGDRLYGAANLTNAFWVGTVAGGEPGGLGFGMFANSTGGIDSVHLSTAGARRVSAMANGNVGINNVTPTDALTVTGNINYSGTAYATQATLTDGATISWTTTNAQVATVTLAGNRTMAAPTGLINGAFYALAVIQDATGGRTLAWNSVFKWTLASAPTLTTTANARDYFVFRSDGTNLYEQGRALGVA